MLPENVILKLMYVTAEQSLMQKSLLGMLYLGVCKELTIKYGEKDARFEQVVGKYAIA